MIYSYKYPVYYEALTIVKATECGCDQSWTVRICNGKYEKFVEVCMYELEYLLEIHRAAAHFSLSSRSLAIVEMLADLSAFLHT